jgi:hypothetical protein
MRIRINTDPVGPVSVIPELPDAPLALLEGLNGIGKTLAIRLLQLCTGDLPYSRDAPAWASLCEGLGTFQVSVENLNGANEIRWAADSREWSISPTDTEFPSFTSITIDGRTASMEEVRSFLSVHRIGGDEGIVEVLAQQTDAAAERVRRWARMHTAVEASPLAQLESILADAVHLLGDTSSAAYAELESVVAEAVQARQLATEALEEATGRREAVHRAVEAFRALNELQSIAPDLLARVAAIDAQIEAVQTERARIQRDMVALAGTVASTEPVLHELNNARRTLSRNRSKLSEALNEASALASELRVEATAKAVDELIGSLKARESVLREEQTGLDAAPAMRTLLDDFSLRLTDAETHGLGDQVAIDDPETDIRLTVTQTRTGMETRRTFLEGQPPPPQAREVAEQLAEVERMLSRAGFARQALSDVSRYERLVRQSEDRVDRAVQATDPHAVSKLQGLEAQRREGDDQLLVLAAERASARQQLGVLSGGLTVDQLRLELTRTLEQLDIEPQDLNEAYAEAERRVADHNRSFSEADQQVSTTRRDLARTTAEIKRVAAIVSSSQQWAWIRRSTPLVPAPDWTPTQQLNALDSIRGRLAATAERLGALRIQVAAIENALRGVARHLRGEDPEAVEYLEELQESFGQKFSEWFNIERVRHELLPHAVGAISVDLNRRTVDWKTKTGEHSRPLEAFSSGEQAFAYTRARLAVLDEEKQRANNRLIVLDEFGAFIAYDRLDALLAYIRERGADHPWDQVLVVLPLSSDYGQMALNATGQEAERLTELANEIKRQRFAVQVLTK